MKQLIFCIVFCVWILNGSCLEVTSQDNFLDPDADQTGFTTDNNSDMLDFSDFNTQSNIEKDIEYNADTMFGIDETDNTDDFNDANYSDE